MFSLIVLLSVSCALSASQSLTSSGPPQAVGQGNVQKDKDDDDSFLVPGIILGSVGFVILVAGVLLVGWFVVRPRWKKRQQAKKKAREEVEDEEAGETEDVNPEEEESSQSLCTPPVPQEPPPLKEANKEPLIELQDTQRQNDQEMDPHPKHNAWEELKENDAESASLIITEDTKTIPHHHQSHFYNTHLHIPLGRHTHHPIHSNREEMGLEASTEMSTTASTIRAA